MLRDLADAPRAVIADPQIDTVAMPAGAQAIVGAWGEESLWTLAGPETPNTHLTDPPSL